MRNLRLRSGAVVFSLVLAPLLLVSADSLAQEGNRPRVSIRLADVKSDSVAQFEAAIAEIGGVLEAAGRQYFHVYERVRGDLPGYSIISEDGDINGLPGVDIGGSLLDRVNHSLNGNTRLSVEFIPELGISSRDGVEPSGRYLYVRVRTTSPANARGFLAAQAEEVVPALEAGGVTDRRFGRVMYGGNPNTFVNFTYSDEFPGSSGGNPVAEAIGQRDFDRMIGRLNGLISTAEDLIYVFRPDLSFTAD